MKLRKTSNNELLKKKAEKKVVLKHDILEKWLGSPPFKRDDRKREEVVGIATVEEAICDLLK